ncbi:MAG: ATP-binding protein [Candidatus Riflebacteria bacterium]|nr:ATP-binding protein [Candidatus Riflebacteria bacterium]
MEVTQTIFLRLATAVINTSVNSSGIALSSAGSPDHTDAERAITFLTRHIKLYNESVPAGTGSYNILHVRLALDEALLNALEHGCSRSPGAVQILFRLSPDVLEISVEDPGNGFAYSEIKFPSGKDVEALIARGMNNPKGWGLAIVQSVCRDIFWNRLGNRITLIFHP